MKNTVVSGRYAKALFELASSQNQIDKIQDDLKLIDQTLKQYPDFSNLLFQPIIASSDKKEMFSKIFTDKLSNFTANFVNLLIDKKREALIEEISDLYISMVNSLHSKVVAKVYTAVEFEGNELSFLQTRLESYLDKKVDMETYVDKNIVGGVLIKIGDRVIDGTVKTRLENMSKSLR